MKMTELQKRKLESRRFWFVAWAACTTSLWGTISLFQAIAHPWLGLAIPLLIAMVASYVTIETVKKKSPEVK